MPSWAWTFSGALLDGAAGDRIVVGTGEAEALPGRYALAGLVDAHSHPTVAADEHGPYLADREYGAARLDEYAASGVTVIRDAGGRSQVTLSFPAGDRRAAQSRVISLTSTRRATS